MTTYQRPIHTPGRAPVQPARQMSMLEAVITCSDEITDRTRPLPAHVANFSENIMNDLLWLLLVGEYDRTGDLR